ncbi:MAG TPA: hypothetical protein VGM27_28320 [Acidobacteriaceae bacterium]
MIQTKSGHHVWSETFRRELKDVFAIQEEIAQSVADLLRLHMPEVQGSVRPSAPNLDAYTRYLRARFLIHQQSPEALHAALEQLRKLIEAYPDYALAYSDMAAARGLLALFGVVSGREVYPEVKANAERGYALDQESGETCTVLGGRRAWFEHRWDEANGIYDRALKLQPATRGPTCFAPWRCCAKGTSRQQRRDFAALRNWTRFRPATAHEWLMCIM